MIRVVGPLIAVPEKLSHEDSPGNDRRAQRRPERVELRVRAERERKARHGDVEGRGLEDHILEGAVPRIEASAHSSARRTLAYGVDGIEHVAGTSRRGYSPKVSDLRRSYDDVIELIGRSGVYFTPTVLIYGGWSLALAREPELVRERRFETLFPAWAQDRFKSAPVAENVDAAREVVAPIFETVRSISDRGGRILAGTDSPILPYGLSLLLEIEQLAEAGLGAMEALKSATRVAAEALGVGDELGTIEVGKIADLVLLGGNPLENIENLRKTEMVILNGRLVTVEQLLRSP